MTLANDSYSIKYENTAKVDFKDYDKNGFFIYNGQLYLKLPKLEFSEFNAVKLDPHVVMTKIDNTAEVQPVFVSLSVNRG